MEEEVVRTKNILEFINAFKAEFLEKFGITPHVIFNDKQDVVPALSIPDMVKIGNKFVDLKKYPQGIRTKTRKAEVVFIRQCIVSLCQGMGYPYQTIGNHVGLDHSTCIYAKRVIDKFLSMEDRKTLLIINLIKDVIKDKLGNDGDAKSHCEEGFNTQSILSSILHQGECSHIAHQQTSGTESVGNGLLAHKA
jgi:hypothetical protein